MAITITVEGCNGNYSEAKRIGVNNRERKRERERNTLVDRRTLIA